MAHNNARWCDGFWDTLYEGIRAAAIARVTSAIASIRSAGRARVWKCVKDDWKESNGALVRFALASALAMSADVLHVEG